MAQAIDVKGLTPLHACLFAQCSKIQFEHCFEVVDALLKVYPEAARMRDRSYRLPLLMAVHNSVAADVVELILIANPNAILQGDKVSNSTARERHGQGDAELDIDGIEGEIISEIRISEKKEKKQQSSFSSSSGEVFRMMEQLENIEESPNEEKKDSPSESPKAQEVHEVQEVKEQQEQSINKNSLPRQNILTKFLTNHILQPDLALHIALELLEPDWEVIILILDNLPAAASVLNSRSQIPLFTAIRKKAPAKVLHALLGAHPGALFIRDVVSTSTRDRNGDGISALECALDEYSESIIDQHAQWLASYDQREQFSDDFVLKATPGEEAIIAIIGKFPLCAFDKQTESTVLPFDDAIGSGKWGLAKYLLEYCIHKDNESAASLSSFDPLIDAIEQKAPLEIVKLICVCFPESVTIERKDKRHPLHVAAMHSEDPRVVVFILENFPLAATFSDNIEQRLPLHYLSESGPRFYSKRDLCGVGNILDMFNRVIQAFPAAAEMKDSDFCTPFQIGYSVRTNSAILDYLLHAYPKATAVLDFYGKLPIEAAISDNLLKDTSTAGDGFETLAVIMSHSMPCMKGTNTYNVDYMDAWHTVLKEGGRFLPLIERMMDYFSLSHILCRSLSIKNKLSALEVCCEDSKEILMKRIYFFGRFSLPTMGHKSTVKVPPPKESTCSPTHPPRCMCMTRSLNLNVNLEANMTAPLASPKSPKSPTKTISSPLKSYSRKSGEEEALSANRFMCGLIAIDKLHQKKNKKIGIIFCQDMMYRDLIHYAEKKRLDKKRKALLRQKKKKLKVLDITQDQVVVDQEDQNDVILIAKEDQMHASEWWDGYLSRSDEPMYSSPENNNDLAIALKNENITLTLQNSPSYPIFSSFGEKCEKSTGTGTGTGTGKSMNHNGSSYLHMESMKSHHGRTLLLTKRLEKESDYHLDMLERSIGAEYSEAVKFCAVFDVQETDDLRDIMKWIDNNMNKILYSEEYEADEDEVEEEDEDDSIEVEESEEVTEIEEKIQEEVEEEMKELDVEEPKAAFEESAVSADNDKMILEILDTLLEETTGMINSCISDCKEEVKNEEEEEEAEEVIGNALEVATESIITQAADSVAKDPFMEANKSKGAIPIPPKVPREKFFSPVAERDSNRSKASSVFLQLQHSLMPFK